MTGYKVVYRKRVAPQKYELVSAYYPDYWYGAVRYGVGIRAVPAPECGPLCVFNNEKDAIDFCDCEFDCPTNDGRHIGEVYRCEYEPSEKVYIWTSVDPFGRLLEALPPGTVLADSVTLLERVYPS